MSFHRLDIPICGTAGALYGASLRELNQPQYTSSSKNNSLSSIIARPPDNYEICEMEISDDETTARTEHVDLKNPSKQQSSLFGATTVSSEDGKSLQHSCDEELDIDSLLERDVDEENELELRRAALMSLQSKVIAELESPITNKEVVIATDSESEVVSAVATHQNEVDREEGECTEDECDPGPTAKQLAALDSLLANQRSRRPSFRQSFSSLASSTCSDSSFDNQFRNRRLVRAASRSRLVSLRKPVRSSVNSNRSIAPISCSLAVTCKSSSPRMVTDSESESGSSSDSDASLIFTGLRWNSSRLKAATKGSRLSKYRQMRRAKEMNKRREIDAFERLKAKREATIRIAQLTKRLAEAEADAEAKRIQNQAAVASQVDQNHPPVASFPLATPVQSTTYEVNVGQSLFIPPPPPPLPPTPTMLPLPLPMPVHAQVDTIFSSCGPVLSSQHNQPVYSAEPLDFSAVSSSASPFVVSAPITSQQSRKSLLPTPVSTSAVTPSRDTVPQSEPARRQVRRKSGSQVTVTNATPNASAVSKPAGGSAQTTANVGNTSSGISTTLKLPSFIKKAYAGELTVRKTRFSYVRNNATAGNPVRSSNFGSMMRKVAASSALQNIDDKRFVVNLESSSDDETVEDVDRRSPKKLRVASTGASAAERKVLAAAVSSTATEQEKEKEKERKKKPSLTPAPFGTEIASAATQHNESQRDYFEAKRRLAIEQKEREKLKGLIKAHRDLQSQTCLRISKFERRLADLRTTERQQSTILESLLRRSTTLAHRMKQRSKQMAEAYCCMREAKQRQVECIRKQQTCVKLSDEAAKLHSDLAAAQADLHRLRDETSQRIELLTATAGYRSSSSAACADHVLETTRRLLTCPMHRYFPPLVQSKANADDQRSHSEDGLKLKRVREINTPVCPFELTSRNGCVDASCSLRHVSKAKQCANAGQIEEDVALGWRRSIARYWKTNKAAQQSSPYACPLCGNLDLDDACAAEHHFKENSCDSCIQTLELMAADAGMAVRIRCLMTVAHHLIVRFRLSVTDNNNCSDRQSGGDKDKDKGKVSSLQLEALGAAFCSLLPAFEENREAVAVVLKHVAHLFGLFFEADAKDVAGPFLHLLHGVCQQSNYEVYNTLSYLLWQSVRNVPLRMRLIEALVRAEVGSAGYGTTSCDWLVQLVLTYIYVSFHFSIDTANGAREFLNDRFDSLRPVFGDHLATLALLRIGLMINVLPVVDHSVCATPRCFAPRFDLETLRVNGLLINWSLANEALLAKHRLRIEQLFKSAIDQSPQSHAVYTNWFGYLAATRQSPELHDWCERVCKDTSSRLSPDLKLEAVLSYLHDTLVLQQQTDDTGLLEWIERATSSGKSPAIASCFFYVLVMHRWRNAARVALADNDTIRKLLHFYFATYFSVNHRRHLRSSLQSFAEFEFESIECSQEFEAMKAALPDAAKLDAERRSDCDAYTHMLFALWLLCQPALPADPDRELVHKYVRFVHDNCFVDTDNQHQVAAFSVELSVLLGEQQRRVLRSVLGCQLSSKLPLSSPSLREMRCAELLNLFSPDDCFTDWISVIEAANDLRSLQLVYLACGSQDVRARVLQLLKMRFRVPMIGPAFSVSAPGGSGSVVWPTPNSSIDSCSWHASGWLTQLKAAAEQLSSLHLSAVEQQRDAKSAEIKGLIKRINSVSSSVKFLIKKFDAIGYSHRLDQS